MFNHVHHGDCLEVLKTFPSEQVDLVYMDPPFFTQKTHSLKSRDLTEYSFADTWDSLDQYIDFLRVRIREVQRVMKPTATIFVHCDRNASHRVRLLLDEIFGYERFIAEIIWTYRRWSNSNRTLLPSHQTIYMYGQSEDYTFNEILQPYSETTNLDQILQKRERDENGKTVYAENEDGQVILNGPKRGVPLSDTWEIPYLNPKARERTGYPTQKPMQLMERIIALASNKGDVVLDPFCGSGTTLVAADRLERFYIGIDSSDEAVQLSRERLENPVISDSALMKNGRKSYENQPAEIQRIIETLPAKIVQRNAGIDAIHDHFIDGKPIVIKVQREDETLMDAATKLERAGHKKNAILMVLIRTHQTHQAAFFEETLPECVVVIDSLDLLLQRKMDQNLIPDHP